MRYLHTFSSLRDWYDNSKSKKADKSNKLKQALSKLNIPNEFPNRLVYEAYKNPNIDKSEEKFSWSMPQLDLIRK